MNQLSGQETKLLLNQLLKLLKNFEDELESGEVRQKVQALVPVQNVLAKIGPSVIPRGLKMSARNRLLHYFQAYPYILIPREELMIVAGIDEWARRVRELRVEYGWAIITGITAKEMAEQEGFPLNGVDVQTSAPYSYILISTERDRDAAYRCNIAKDIRNRNINVRDKVLAFFRENVGKPITGEELRYVAKDKTEWARRVRELRTEYGWPIATKSSGRPDLDVGVYILEQDRQSPEHDRQIKDEVRREVLRRDGYQCRRCSWNHDLWNRSDPRHLELHHVEAHVAGGENTEDNLVTLCTVCHDTWHASENRGENISFWDWA